MKFTKCWLTQILDKIRKLGYAVLNCVKDITMAQLVEKLKAFGWILMIVFTISGFVQMLLTFNPRITSLENRMTVTENKVSNMEVKLDAILDQSRETQKDVKDIYRVLIER